MITSLTSHLYIITLLLPSQVDSQPRPRPSVTIIPCPGCSKWRMPSFSSWLNNCFSSRGRCTENAAWISNRLGYFLGKILEMKQNAVFYESLSTSPSPWGWPRPARVRRIIICWLPPNVNRFEICRVLVSRRSPKLGSDSNLFVTSLPGHNYDHNIDRLTQSSQHTT